MKFLKVAFALAVSSFSWAQDPSDCSGDDPVKNGADFVLTDEGDNPYLTSLSTLFTNAGTAVLVADVFDDANHALSTNDLGQKMWESSADFDDENTTKWVPQGITSTADALDEGVYEEKQGWIVSWHRDDDASVRVTFVDKVTDKYRHVLLVEPDAEDDFSEVPVHAGGIMWYGDTLWVVDTSNGIRVFDLNNLWQVESGDAVGKNDDGTYTAAGYEYVLPQIRSYQWSSSFNFQFSFIALDRTATPDSLMVGEYQTDDIEPIRLVQWQLDYSTRKLKANSTTVAASWASCFGIERVQGAVQANGKIYLSRSNGESDGDMFGWIPGSEAHENTGFFPPSPEDLSYDQNGEVIYSLTEATGARFILTEDASSVVFE